MPISPENFDKIKFLDAKAIDFEGIKKDWKITQDSLF